MNLPPKLSAERVVISDPPVTNDVAEPPVIPEVKTNSIPRSQVKAPRQPKEPLKDPDARVALAHVGLDPEAEAYWYGAINDPTLSAQEREDLIEDLNEEGFADPKHPSLEELPLILRRLELIELLAPYAMDQVNLNSFAEAYKDLQNLAEVALGGGAPVR